MIEAFCVLVPIQAEGAESSVWSEVKLSVTVSPDFAMVVLALLEEIETEVSIGAAAKAKDGQKKALNVIKRAARAVLGSLPNRVVLTGRA